MRAASAACANIAIVNAAGGGGARERAVGRAARPGGRALRGRARRARLGILTELIIGAPRSAVACEIMQGILVIGDLRSIPHLGEAPPPTGGIALKCTMPKALCTCIPRSG